MSNLGTLEGIFRYPVKSMSGERLEETKVDENGVRGDRIYGLVDVETGKLASAKQPRAWGDLLKFKARVLDERRETVEITAPLGASMVIPTSEATEFLGSYFGRSISACRTVGTGILLDRIDPLAWIEGGPYAAPPVESHQIARGAPAGSLFDFAPIHVVTTASLARIKALHPAGRSEAARYRPNLLIRSPDSSAGFVENEWANSTIRVGPDLTLGIIMPTPRCVIPTLEHADLPADADALRVLVKANMLEVQRVGIRPCVGVYAKILVPGQVAQGDQIVFL